MGGTDDGIWDRVWVPPVEENNTTENACLGPVANTVGDAFGVLTDVVIPPMLKKIWRKCGREARLVLLRGPPETKRIILMSVCVQLIEPDGDLVNGSCN